jgi:hypothetical protein
MKIKVVAYLIAAHRLVKGGQFQMKNKTNSE